jgi:anhydro-N-acetylmuramic acid kinase
VAEFKAIGLMSGTSMDGVDAAVIRSDGIDVLERGPSFTLAYRADFRKRLAAALDDARSIIDRDKRPGDLAAVERELTSLHAQAVEQLLDAFSINREEVDLIGFHGHTVLHRPERGLTIQIGDGQELSRMIGIPVVYDMRAGDMKAGGEGAPLAPAYHGALARSLDGEWPVAFVNIGGISNITLVEKDGRLAAFDTGPGNALIDQWVEAKAGIPMDQGGAIASEGGVLQRLVQHYLEAPFFQGKKRRSLDRNDFLPLDPGAASLEDGARSLARVTAEAIFLSASHLPNPPKRWIICGGGRLNRTIMADLHDLASADGSSVVTAEQAGFDGDSMEAEAWAFLAIRSRLGMPISWPETTGCRKPTCGGIYARSE